MTEQDKGKKGTRRLLWVGFVLLVLVVGLGPLLMVIFYTRDINPVDYLRFFGTREEVEAAPEPPGEPYLAQYLYRFCEHHAVYEPHGIPPDLEIPPAALVEMAVALHESNTSIQNIMSHLKDTDGWYVADMRVGSENSFFTFTYLDDLCPDCKGRYYLGIFNDGTGDFIALYEGRPPGGRVARVTPYKVRDDVRAELEEGVVLESPDQLHEILQDYTS